MNSVVAFTVIYPSALKYLCDFIECLYNQTYKDFDLLVVNDGCELSTLNLISEYPNSTIINSVSSPVKNREIGINTAIERGYKQLIFCDIDDWFLPTRFATSLSMLGTSDIVVNNLNIVGENRECLCERYFSYSINKDTIIDAEFLKHKNLLGLSNTAINVNEKIFVDFPHDITIGDWYYFAICAERGLSIAYCDEALTDYRQHSNNLIGIDDFSVDLFKKLIKLKIEHFWYLSKIYPEYDILYKKSRELENISDVEIQHLIKKNKSITPHPLWWENIKQ